MCSLLESYSETQEQSSHLASIPKIFLNWICVVVMPKQTLQEFRQPNETAIKTIDDDNRKQEIKAAMDAMIDETKEKSKLANETKSEKTQTTRAFQFCYHLQYPCTK